MSLFDRAVIKVHIRSNWPKWIVIHTAAADRLGVTIEDIDYWHRQLGWAGCGYHVVIEDDGAIRAGRSYDRRGAHARGMNHKSIGICMTGHGDVRDFNPAQYDALFPLLEQLCRRFNIPVDHVIGHREIKALAGAPDPHKSCPGNKVVMKALRNALRQEINDAV